MKECIRRKTEITTYSVNILRDYKLLCSAKEGRDSCSTSNGGTKTLGISSKSLLFFFLGSNASKAVIWNIILAVSVVADLLLAHYISGSCCKGSRPPLLMPCKKKMVARAACIRRRTSWSVHPLLGHAAHSLWWELLSCSSYSSSMQHVCLSVCWSSCAVVLSCHNSNWFGWTKGPALLIRLQPANPIDRHIRLLSVKGMADHLLLQQPTE